MVQPVISADSLFKVAAKGVFLCILDMYMRSGEVRHLCVGWVGEWEGG